MYNQSLSPPGWSSENKQSNLPEQAISIMSFSRLFLGVFFSSFGLAYFIYGRKQQAIIPLLCGIALMAYPYFVTNMIIFILLGIVLLGLPFFYRI